MENKHDIQIEELFIPSKDAKDSYLCEDFIIYPEGKEKDGGYVLGIIELRATPTDEGTKIIQAIVNTIKENYYEQIVSSPEPQKLNLETVFEHALQRANDAITDMIEMGNIRFALENLNYVIAVAKPNPTTKDIEFFFAHQGLIQVYLLHKTKQNNYKVINIVENTPRFREDNGSQLKIFSSTLAGKVFYHDVLFMCSEIFSNYIPAHKVNKVVADNELSPAIDQFKSLINNVRNHSHLTYSAIFVKMSERKNPNDKPISQRSIDQLLSTSENTEKYLTPTFALNIKANIAKIFSGFKREKMSKHLAAPSDQPRMRFSAVKYFFHIIKLIALTIFSFVQRVIDIATGKRKLTLSFFRKSANLAHDAMGNSKSKFTGLPKFNKSILVVIVALVIIFVGSIFYVRWHQANVKEQAAYATSIQQLQEQINNAQVNLIYQNSDQSLLFLQAAEKALAALPQKTATQKTNYADLNQQIVTLQNKLLHIDKLVPQLVAEISDNNLPVNLTKLIASGNNILAIADAKPTIYSINAANKAVTPIASNAGNFVFGLQDEDKLYALTDQNKLYKVENNSLAEQTFTLGNAQIAAMKIYNGNIYLLDSVAQQICKYPSATGGFGGQQQWFKDKGTADLSKAVDIALDGNAYILTSDAKVIKYFNGRPADFKLGVIEPAISQATKIVGNFDLANIYLLDSAAKRIVVLDKTGKVIQQYLFDTVSDPIKDFTVDEKNKTMFFVSGNKVYQAALK